MDSNYQPSFEVVDNAEDAEDYLLAKNRRTVEEKPTIQTEVSTISNTSTNCDITTNEDDTMNLNGLNFLSSTPECKDVEDDKVDSVNSDLLKCVTEDEEGQEALWLEESDNTPSASSMNTSPNVNKSSTRRSSFLFGKSGGTSKKAATTSTKRSISLRKKKNVPKVMLLDGQPAPVTSDVVPGESSKDVAFVPATAASRPDAVIASDTISSLGFDKSFDVRSPLSMSSLNEILDAPLTPTASTEESAAVASAVKAETKRAKKKNIVSGMFRKKAKKVKAKGTFSFINRSRYARSVVVVEKDDKEDDDVDVADPVLRATRDINERIHASLMHAMENDDAESLTSFTGVPMIMKDENNTTSKPNEKARSLTILQGQKPLNFEKVKPTFVVSKDSLSLAEIQEKFVPMFDDDEDEDEEAKNEEDLASPCNSNEGEYIEALKSASPSSTGADSTITDRYDVAQNIGDDNESDCDDVKSDKYSVLPDPCSFCDSFWVSTDNQSAVSKTMSESPGKEVEPNRCGPDSPVIDKYTELAEVVATTNDITDPVQESSIGQESALNKSTTVATSNRTFSSLFGKARRQASVSTMSDVMVASNSAITSRNVESVLSEQENHVTKSESTNDESKLYTEDENPTASTDLPSEPDVVTSKNTKTGFFGKLKKPFASTNKSNDIASDPTVVESSRDAPACEDAPAVAPSKVAPRKSILKKRKEVMMIPVDTPDSYIVPGNDLESPGAKISVLSLRSDAYVVPAAATSMTVTSKSTVSLEQNPPIEDPSTEGSSSVDDDIANSKIVSIEPASPSKTNNTDPLLTRLRKNLHKRRGLEPQSDVDPIITVGNGRTRLDP